MIAVVSLHALRLGIEHVDHRGVEAVPHSGFHLEIEAEFVAGLECRFRRAPGVKAHSVEAVILTGLDDFLPSRNVGGGITGEWEIAAGVGHPEVDFFTVQEQLVPAVRYLAQAKGNRTLVGTRATVENNADVLEHWMKFIPRLGIGRQVNFGLKISAFFIPTNVLCFAGG